MLAAVLLLAACGDDSPSNSTTAEAPADTPDAPVGDDSPDDAEVETSEKPEVPLPDGDVAELVLEDLIVGEGDPAEAGDNVVVHYVGVRATDGVEFDASYNRNQPFEFQLGEGRVIPGWDQGVAGMAPGGRRVLTIPSDMAYGPGGSGEDIPPDTDLVFVVDLISATSPADEVSALFDDGRTKPEPILPAGPVAELTIQDVTPGTGTVAETGDQVQVHYVGVFADGAEFDASWNRGAEPFEFVLGRGMVIDGWDEGVVGMSPGGRRNLQIPFEAAYGAEGRPPTIPASADLVFVVDLLGVTKPTSPEEAPTYDFPTSVTGELEVSDLAVGEGPALGPGDTGVMHLTLTAYNTKVVVDSTYEDGFPVPIPLGVGSLFPGLEEGLTGMQVGGQRLVVIPSDLAFGDAGREPDIGPGETLVVVAELFEIR